MSAVSPGEELSDLLLQFGMYQIIISICRKLDNFSSFLITALCSKAFNRKDYRE
jgi:hypothetical protein